MDLENVEVIKRTPDKGSTDNLVDCLVGFTLPSVCETTLYYIIYKTQMSLAKKKCY